MMKILFHSVNGVGLGHLNRTTTIARAMQRIGDVEIEFVTNALDVSLLDGFSYQKISDNPINDFNDSKFIDKFKSIVDSKNPDLIVYDTYFPYDFVKKRTDSCVLVLRLIDNVSLRSLVSDCILDRFLRIIIPHSKEEFEFYDFDEDLKKCIISDDKFVFVGPILRQEFFDEHNDTYESESGSVPRFSVLYGGGGKDKDNTVDSFHDVIDVNMEYLESIGKVSIVRGPYSKEGTFCRDMVKILDESDFVISHAGYNTINELLAKSKRALIFPVKRHNEDQMQRANWFKKKGNGIIFSGNFHTDIEWLMEKEIKRSGIVFNNEIAANSVFDALDVDSLRICLGDEEQNDIVTKKNRFHKEIIIDQIHKFVNKGRVNFYGKPNDDFLRFVVIAKEKGFRKIYLNGERYIS